MPSDLFPQAGEVKEALGGRKTAKIAALGTHPAFTIQPRLVCNNPPVVH
jgi:hypothetical protein